MLPRGGGGRRQRHFSWEGSCSFGVPRPGLRILAEGWVDPTAGAWDVHAPSWVDMPFGGRSCARSVFYFKNFRAAPRRSQRLRADSGQSRTRPPVGQQREQVEDADGAGAVEIGREPGSNRQTRRGFRAIKQCDSPEALKARAGRILQNWRTVRRARPREEKTTFPYQCLDLGKLSPIRSARVAGTRRPRRRPQLRLRSLSAPKLARGELLTRTIHS